MSDAMKLTQAGLIAVPWLQDPTSQAFLQTLGETKDQDIDRCAAGVAMRWPGGAGMQAVGQAVQVRRPILSAAGDPRRIGRILSGFGLERLGAMTDAQAEAYAERAWAVWGQGGTVAAILDALHGYGIPDVDVIEEWQDPTATWGNPGSYGFRFVVILGPDFGSLGWAPQRWPLPIDGSTVLGIADMTPAQLADVAHLIRRWKTAASASILLVFRFGNAPVFDLAGLTWPIPLDAGLTGPAVTFELMAPILKTAEDGGVPFPFPLGPVHVFG